MRLYPREGMWAVEFELDGKRKRLSTGLPLTASREDAEKAASLRMRRSYAAGGKVAGAVPIVSESLTEALERCYQIRWSKQKAERNARQRVTLLQAQIGMWMLKDISYPKLLKLQQDWEKEGFKPATVNRRMNMVKTALKEARRHDASLQVIEVPDNLPENNQKDRYLTDAEEASILKFLDGRVAVEDAEAAANEGHDRTWRQLRNAYVILVDTGMRLSELLDVADKGVFDGVKVTLKTGETKNGKGRPVPLTDRARIAMKAWVAAPRRDLAWASYHWGKVRKATGLADVNLHILRHTCASRLLQKGVNLYVVSKWLGHSSVKVTERYAHLVPDVLDDALQLLNAAAG